MKYRYEDQRLLVLFKKVGLTQGVLKTYTIYVATTGRWLGLFYGGGHSGRER